jgi:hypothetical protein
MIYFCLTKVNKQSGEPLLDQGVIEEDGAPTGIFPRLGEWAVD